MPKGGGAIRGIGEKFAANPVTGTGSLTVPIYASPGRSGFGPQLSLSYDSGAGNGPFGFGWSLAVPSITRKTDKGLPRYDDAGSPDTFILSGAEDLVPALAEAHGTWSQIENQRTLYGQDYRVRRYRPRTEGLFARIERWSNKADPVDVFWRSISKDNIVTWYGTSSESRIADPADPARIFSWLICQNHDDKGNLASYRYAIENSDGVAGVRAHERNRTAQGRSANRYLKRIQYGNRTPHYPDTGAPAPVPEPSDWCFELVFDYGDHDQAMPLPDEPQKTWLCRDDPFSVYRAAFEVRTYRLCRRVLMFHHFPGEPDVKQNCLVRSTDFTYPQDVRPNDPRNPIYALLAVAGQTGYKRQAAGYVSRSLPPLEFEYTEPVIDTSTHEIDRSSLENLPQGLDGTRYQWVDLDSEGISGILTEQAESWFYKRNLSPVGSPNEPTGPPAAARFAPAELARRKPSLGTLGGGQQLLDLAGDGQLDLVQFDSPTPGFFERTESGDWTPLQPFTALPVLNWQNPNLKFIDLTGDGHADILISEDDVLCWHVSLAEAGFGPAQRARQALDEEKGPKLVFADGTESIFVADLSGDGLTDIVRIRNGEVCYWPNLGYGRFGAKVTMDNSPWFEAVDLFDGRRIRLADIDGSGTVDIIYFSSRGTRIYFNQSGNSWSERRTLEQFPPVDQTSSAMVVDLLGNGTACLVWSSSLPGNANRALRYVDLMGGAKPNLLVRIVNNLGMETRIQYAPSTRFYLEDRLAGKPWITRLPFPVHVVARVETYDYVSRNRFITRHAYHHGYFDGVEREFRGFGMVEQWDTEEFAALTDSGDFPSATNIDAAAHVPPVLTRTWFHTGVYLGRQRVSNYFAGLLSANVKGEYYREPGLDAAGAAALLLDDTVLPDGWSVEEEREACRALKGSMLRQEIYALDRTAKEPHPYSVSEQNFTVQRLQPRANNPFGVFFAHPREALKYNYDRNPADPRTEHAFTLEVNGFGNVLRSLAVGYGRRVPDANLTVPDQQKQSAVLITYTESDHTDAVDLADAYRTPLAHEVRTYELTGFASSGRFAFDDWAANNFSPVAQIPEIAYEQAADTAQQQKRRIEHVRTHFRADDLATTLAQGIMQAMALPSESYKLAFTSGLLANIYRRTVGSGPEEVLLPDPTLVLPGGAGDRGGYVDLDGDGHWWIPSGRAFFDVNADAVNPGTTAVQELARARSHFFQPRKYVDAFDAIATVEYDADDLFPVQQADALGNTTEIALDYRVLQPRLITDPNGNRSEAAFDALGLVAGTAVQGKVTENLGDRLLGFDPDLTQAQIDAFFATADPHSQAQALLADATTRVIYDPHCFRRSRAANPTDPSQWQPSYSATLSREVHVSDLSVAQQSPIQISITYSDGLGHEIQKRIQAEPGPLMPNGSVVSPRWVATGWTILNNKGKPVRQYEPYFSATHQFEFAQTVGTSPIIFYDPLGRAIATVRPDHSWEKIVFDPWRQESWDASDTVLIADPKTDTDVGDYFSRLPDADYLPSWYDRRQGGALGAAAQAAADKTAIHANTPAVAHFDSLGRAFLTIAHNKYNTAVTSDPAFEEFYLTHTLLDIVGNQREVIDAKDRVIARCDYDVLSRRIHSTSMEAGERWMLNDIVGNPLQSWDNRNHRLRSDYDPLRRPTDTFLYEGSGPEILVGRNVYGETRPNPEAANLRGKLIQVLDQAGVAGSDEYDFKGNLLRSQRQFAQDYKATLDLSTAVALDAPIYTSRTRFDAMNRPIELTAPDSSVIRPGYNEASLLERMEVNLRGAQQNGQPLWVPFVAHIGYDAKGQRQAIAYANGATTAYDYDPDTFRLAQLNTSRASDAANLQDLFYTYDPVGNVTAIADQAQQAIYFNNQVVTASANYEYDSLHRLIAATGREHLGQTGRQLNAPGQPDYDDAVRARHPHPSDGNAVGNYIERYDYDAVGNILKLIHTASSGGWTRRYDYETGSNRLRSTSLPGDPAAPFSARYDHDAHGNMVQMPHLAQMLWDFKDNLHEVDLGGGGRAYFVYDAAGQRVRKVWEKSASLIEERFYLGAFEIFRRSNGGTLTLERQTLHVLDGHNRIAMVETKTVDSGAPILLPADVTRYQFANHLGSAVLELDDAAAIISYEEYFSYGGTSLQTVNGAVEVSLKRYRYQGKERDEETGLDYFGARHYAAWLGRWVSADPAGHVDGLNLYQFVRCNPLILTDPSGTQSAPADPDGDPKLYRRAPDYVGEYLKEIAQIQENYPTAKITASGWSQSDKDGMRTMRISYDVVVPSPSQDNKPLDGGSIWSIQHNLSAHVEKSWTFPTPVETPAAADDPAAASGEAPSSGATEHDGPSGGAESSPAEHEPSGISKFLEKVQKFFEYAEDIKKIAEPIIDYLAERFSKLGEQLKKLGEVPWIKRVLRYAKPVFEHAGNVLTGAQSIIEGIKTGSLRPVFEGAGEIAAGLAAEAILTVVTAIAVFALAFVGAPAWAEAAVLVAIGAFSIWAAPYVAKFGKWVGGQVFDFIQATVKAFAELPGVLRELKYKTLKGLTDFNNWNPGLAR
jgi:RHS repeat-associated protein